MSDEKFKFPPGLIERLLAQHPPRVDHSKFKIRLATVENWGATLCDVIYSSDHQSIVADFRLGGYSGKLGLFDQPNEAVAERNLRNAATEFQPEISRVFDELHEHTGYYAPRVLFETEQLPTGVKRIDVEFVSPLEGYNDYHSAYIRIFKTCSTNPPGKPDIYLSVRKRY